MSARQGGLSRNARRDDRATNSYNPAYENQLPARLAATLQPKCAETSYEQVRWQNLRYVRGVMKPEGDLGLAVARFIEDLEAVPWFKNVGHPLPAELSARQLLRWEDWPGPQEPAIFELTERQQALHDELLASAPDRREQLEILWERIREIVVRRGAPAVPYDANEDSWHGPTAAVWQATWTAGLVAWCVLLGRQVPSDLHEQWRWFMRGHWPSGYTVVRSDGRLGPLLVF